MSWEHISMPLIFSEMARRRKKVKEKWWVICVLVGQGGVNDRKTSQVGAVSL
jgi:hypothetical protein